MGRLRRRRLRRRQLQLLRQLRRPRGSGVGADGGGGAALGGAVFVAYGGTLIMNDGGFTGTYAVTGGVGGDHTGGATDGKAQAR